jgi:hypothetical protein
VFQAATSMTGSLGQLMALGLVETVGFLSVDVFPSQQSACLVIETGGIVRNGPAQSALVGASRGAAFLCDLLDEGRSLALAQGLIGREDDERDRGSIRYSP